MADPVWQTTNSANGNTSSLSLTKPTGTVADDLLLIFLTSDGTVFSPPSGFTEVTNSSASGIKFYVWKKTAGGGEPSSYACTSSGGYAAAVIARISNVSAVGTASTTNSSSVFDSEIGSDVYNFTNIPFEPGQMLIAGHGFIDYSGSLGTSTKIQSRSLGTVVGLLESAGYYSPGVDAGRLSVSSIADSDFYAVAANLNSDQRTILTLTGTVTEVTLAQSAEFAVVAEEEITAGVPIGGESSFAIRAEESISEVHTLEVSASAVFRCEGDIYWRIDGDQSIAFRANSPILFYEEYVVVPFPLKNSDGELQIVQRDDYLDNAELNRSIVFRGEPSEEVEDKTLVGATVIWGARLDVFSFGNAPTVSGWQKDGEIVSASDTEWVIKFELDKTDTDVPVGRYSSDVEITLATGEVVTWARVIVVNVVESYSDPE